MAEVTYRISPDIIELSGSGPEAVSVGFTNRLDSGVTLTIGTVVEVTTTDLTLGSKAINTATFDAIDNGETVTVAIGQGVQFTCAGGTVENSPYTILITVTTSESETLQYGQRVSYAGGAV